jgi:hypothetical protein
MRRDASPVTRPRSFTGKSPASGADTPTSPIARPATAGALRSAAGHIEEDLRLQLARFKVHTTDVPSSPLSQRTPRSTSASPHRLLSTPHGLPSNLSPSLYSPLATALEMDRKSLPRSLSDGDLSDQLRGFWDLKHRLVDAKNVCDDEITDVLSALDDQVERGIFAGENEANLTDDHAVLVSFATELLDLDVLALQTPGICVGLIQKLQTHQALSDPALQPYWTKLMLAFASIASWIEHLDTDARSLQKFQGRFDKTLKQGDDDRGDGDGVNFLMEWSLDGVVRYISPTCQAVFG